MRRLIFLFLVCLPLLWTVVPVAAQSTPPNPQEPTNVGFGVLGVLIGGVIVSIFYFSPFLKKIADALSRRFSAEDIAKTETVKQAVVDAARAETVTRIDAVVDRVAEGFERRIAFVEGQFDHAQQRAGAADAERRKDKDDADAERRQLAGDIRALQNDGTKSRQEASELRSLVVGLETQLKSAITERDQARSDSARAWARVDELSQELRTTNTHLETARVELGKVKEQVARLEGQRELWDQLIERIQPVALGIDEPQRVRPITDPTD